jgi:hypothetical protein
MDVPSIQLLLWTAVIVNIVSAVAQIVISVVTIQRGRKTLKYIRQQIAKTGREIEDIDREILANSPHHPPIRIK